jgi:hypothetical protein
LEELVKSGKRTSGIVMFPPNPEINGGGYVIFLRGALPRYVPPSIDPWTLIPPPK